MSSDNEYVALLNYALCLNVDLSTFPILWAVLSILLDTQDDSLEYVKFNRRSTTDTMQINPENIW